MSEGAGRAIDTVSCKYLGRLHGWQYISILHYALGCSFTLPTPRAAYEPRTMSRMWDV